eukprot:c1627_g1_i1 orf=324-506(+)
MLTSSSYKRNDILSTEVEFRQWGKLLTAEFSLRLFVGCLHILVGESNGSLHFKLVITLYL